MSDGNGVIDTLDDLPEPLHSGPCAVDDWCARCEERTVAENTRSRWDTLTTDEIAAIVKDALAYLGGVDRELARSLVRGLASQDMADDIDLIWRYSGRPYDPQQKRGGR